MPIITAALIMVFFDRNFGTNFFVAANGGDPLLYQHLFWLFGHPEVYILILPGMGIVSEVLPVFSRKPLFGYRSWCSRASRSASSAGACGRTTCSPPAWARSRSRRSALSTMLIAIPTGVKIFNWIGTVWGGSVRLTVAMLFALGFIAMFTHRRALGRAALDRPADTQQTDTYFVVAHFHYVLFGGSMFGSSAASTTGSRRSSAGCSTSGWAS